MGVIERHIRNLSMNSQRRYKTVLDDFQRFTSKPLVSSNESDIFEYFDYLKSKQGIKPRKGRAAGLSGATIRNTLELLSSAFAILHRRNLIAYNPVRYSGIKFPHGKKNQKRPTEILPFNKVMEVCQKPAKNTKTGVRDRAILACLFGAGLRKSEAINLTLDDVKIEDESTLYLWLHETKSGRDREQCLATWAAESVTRLIEQRIAEKAKSTDPLFVQYRQKCQPLNYNIPVRTFDRIFKKYVAELKDGIYSPHSARATAISFLWHTETDSRRIQEFARHADFSSTIVYDRRGLKDTARKLFFPQ